MAELEAACRAGRVREVKGFGARTEQRILENLAGLPRAPSDRLLLSDALDVGERLAAPARAATRPPALELAGSARRMSETVGDLDLVASSPLSRRGGRTSRRLPVGGRGPGARRHQDDRPPDESARRSDLRVVPPEEHATALHHLTGSSAHHVRLRGPGSRSRLQPLGARAGAPRRTARRCAVASRGGAVPAARPALHPARAARGPGRDRGGAWPGPCPRDLVRLEDVRGMVHCHTRWSDGRNTLEEMARAADALGRGVPHRHRSLALRRTTPAGSRSTGWSAVGRDRPRPGAGAGAAPAGHRVGHHRGRRARLPRRRAGAARRGDRERPLHGSRWTRRR